MQHTKKSSISKNWPIELFIRIIAFLFMSGGVLIIKDDSYAQVSGQRLNEVNQLGSQIMPFDLKRTMHTFTSDANGGTQSVTANNPSNLDQIQLIQSHLQKEAKNFTKGNFTDPATIHGARMPGLAELRNGANRINIRYEALSNGARLRYSSSDPQLIGALHKWFEAQNTDHNGHQGRMHR